MLKLKFTLLGVLAMGSFSSCAFEPDEKPIRPTSENSDIAHGSSNSSGGGILGGLGQGGLSR